MAAVAPPWTRGLSLSWRPALRFYERRFEILRTLDDAGVLAAFKVEEDEIDARLTGGHQLSVDSDGLRLDLFGQGADPDPTWEHVEMVSARIEPKQIRSTTTRFQHVIALDLSFADAIAACRERLFPMPALADVSYQDFALLVDFAGTDDMNAQAEFGVIRAHEVPARLSRRAGRMGAPGPVAGPPWEPKDFGEVSLFVDSRWRLGKAVDREDVHDLKAFWDLTCNRATEFADALYETIIK